jgi:steroid 5-alpha reductase family enzyme
MTLAWARQLRTRNATSVDALWALCLGALVASHAWRHDGDAWRRALVAALALAWALRLAGHLLLHRIGRDAPEDGRYRAMREHWGPRAPTRFLAVYQAQALAATLMSLPPIGALGGGTLDGWAVAGAAVALLALSGEALADRQLARFRADPGNRGRTCRAGLWRYSRHPNYFFEWLFWWSFVVAGRGAMLTWLGPALMLAFLYRLTGIPWTERQALRSRGDDYREYQRTTSAFFPWFPKEGR